MTVATEILRCLISRRTSVMFLRKSIILTSVHVCPRFKVKTTKKRWEMVKEQQAYFSCLKRSKGHTASNNLRRKECSERKHMTVSLERRLHLLHETEREDQNKVVGFCKTTVKHLYLLFQPKLNEQVISVNKQVCFKTEVRKLV